MELPVTQERVWHREVCAPLCHLMEVLPDVYCVWQESCVLFSCWCLYCGLLCHYSVIVRIISQCRLYPQNCVNTAFGKISISTHVNHSSATHLQSLERRLHSFSTYMHSQLRASLNVQVVMTTMSALDAIRIWSSSYTVAHVHSFNAMVIMQAILGKQLKQRSVIKDQ